MPRKPRFNLVGIPQHVIQRGNNREPCFYAEEDYRRYLNDLQVSAKKFNCRIHAYVLMTNHVHLLITPMTKYGISQMMQALGRRYVYYINKTYKRTGTLWEGRYKSSLIDSDCYLFICMRYIELNPIRAGMVNYPGEYKWSSYRANAQGDVDFLLDAHPVYLELGTTCIERQEAYRDLFRHYVDNDTLHEIRQSLNHELVLGRSYFKDKIEEVTKRKTRLGMPGRPRIEEEQGVYWVEY
ncbi:MAG: transposase [Gammaproteobacteria bacterium]|nr:MAG: transposase [Gammaproteobacteria bacterium]